MFQTETKIYLQKFDGVAISTVFHCSCSSFRPNCGSMAARPKSNLRSSSTPTAAPAAYAILGVLGLRLQWVSKKSKDLISAVEPITLSRGRERRKNFEIDTPKIKFVLPPKLQIFLILFIQVRSWVTLHFSFNDLPEVNLEEKQERF